MKDSIESRLLEALEKCEIAKQKIEETQGYCEESRMVRMLGELIKEYGPDEDTYPSVVEAR